MRDRSRDSWCVGVAFAVGAMTTAARAADVHWQLPFPGNWHDASNWTEGAVPQVNDTAIFSALQVTVPYTVTVGKSVELDALHVNENDVAFSVGSDMLLFSRMITVGGTTTTGSRLGVGGSLSGHLLTYDLRVAATPGESGAYRFNGPSLFADVVRVGAPSGDGAGELQLLAGADLDGHLCTVDATGRLEIAGSATCSVGGVTLETGAEVDLRGRLFTYDLEMMPGVMLGGGGRLVFEYASGDLVLDDLIFDLALAEVSAANDLVTFGPQSVVTCRIDANDGTGSFGTFASQFTADALVLDGTLHVEHAFQYTPAAGDHYEIFRTDSGVTGLFDAVVGDPLPPGLAYQLTEDGGSIYLSVVYACNADADGSGVVDFNDLLLVLAAWGTPEGDLTGDGGTGFDDVLFVVSEWGPCAG